MIVEKVHFPFAEKYWGGGGGKVPLASPVPTALFQHLSWNFDEYSFKSFKGSLRYERRSHLWSNAFSYDNEFSYSHSRFLQNDSGGKVAQMWRFIFKTIFVSIVLVKRRYSTYRQPFVQIFFNIFDYKSLPLAGIFRVIQTFSLQQAILLNMFGFCLISQWESFSLSVNWEFLKENLYLEKSYIKKMGFKHFSCKKCPDIFRWNYDLSIYW